MQRPRPRGANRAQKEKEEEEEFVWIEAELEQQEREAEEQYQKRKQIEKDRNARKEANLVQEPPGISTDIKLSKKSEKTAKKVNSKRDFPLNMINKLFPLYSYTRESSEVFDDDIMYYFTLMQQHEKLMNNVLEATPRKTQEAYQAI